MFLVTGGITGPGVRLSTTETWRPGELHWTNVGELPVKAAGVRAVSLDNRVFALGEAEYAEEDLIHYFQVAMSTPTH